MIIASIVAVRCLPHARKIGCGWSAGAALTLINASSPKRMRLERNDRHRVLYGENIVTFAALHRTTSEGSLESSEPPRIPFPRKSMYFTYLPNPVKAESRLLHIPISSEDRCSIDWSRDVFTAGILRYDSNSDDFHLTRV